MNAVTTSSPVEPERSEFAARLRQVPQKQSRAGIEHGQVLAIG